MTVITIGLLCQMKFFVCKVFYAYASSVVITAHFKLVRIFKFRLPFKNTISDQLCIFISHT